MPTLPKDQAEIIARGVMYDMVGAPLNVSNNVLPVAVHPAANSQGSRASMAIVRPGGALWFRPFGTTNPLWPTTPAPIVLAAAPSAQLAANTDYIIPLHPGVNTLGFISVDPVGTSGWINFVIGG